MARIVISDVCLVRAVCYSAVLGQIGINDYWYLCQSHAGLGAEDQDFIDQWSVAALPLYRPLMFTGASAYGSMVNRYRLANPVTPFAHSFSGAGAGTAHTSWLPAQVAGLIKKRTAFGGPGGRGRVYIPFPSALSNTNSGAPDATYQINLGLLGAFLSLSLTAGVAPDTSTMIPVLYNRTSNVSTAITSFVAGTEWFTQRRRGFAGARNRTPF